MIILTLTSSALAGGLVTNASGNFSNGLTTTVSANPISTIHLQIGGGNVLLQDGKMKVSAQNGSSISVIASDSSDQYFKDPINNAQFYGYYLSVGVSSTNQPGRSIVVKVRRGAEETPGRSFYVRGNNPDSAKSETDLVNAPVNYSTFATVPSNSTYCGANYQQNRISDKRINCDSGTKMPSLDLTQYVKVVSSDISPQDINSQLDFIAVAE